jgi:membrane fusion protein (multidrug efflux system)
VSGYITEVAVNDYQPVRKGDLIAVIDPSDYQAQLELAKANLAAAQATLANLANQRDVQRALIRQAEATIAPPTPMSNAMASRPSASAIF